MNGTIKIILGCNLLIVAWLICLFNCLHNSTSQHWHKLPNGSFHHHHHTESKLSFNSLLKLTEFLLPHSHTHDNPSHNHSENDSTQTDCCRPDLRLNNCSLTSSQTLIFYSSYYVDLIISGSLESVCYFLKKFCLFDPDNHRFKLILNLLLSLCISANSPPV